MKTLHPGIILRDLEGPEAAPEGLCHASVRPLRGRRASRPAPGSPGGAMRRWTGSGAGLSSDTGRAGLSGSFSADAAAAVRAEAAPPYSAWLYSPSHLRE